MWNVNKISAPLARVIRLNPNGNIAYAIGYYFIALVLLLSGITKILDPWPLIEALKLVADLPEQLLIAVSALLPIIEICLFVLLILKVKPKIVLYAVLALFTSFLLFSIVGTIIGLKADCGCFGSLMRSEIGWGMIIRNLLLLSIVLFLIIKNMAYSKITDI